MEELEDNMSVDDIKDEKDTFFYKIKPKKRSLVERELETNLTERITSPIIIYGDGTNTSRYGRARRLKTDSESNDTERAARAIKSPIKDKSPLKSPVYKMHASNSPIRGDSLNKTGPNTLDLQIESIYNENISLSRFSEDQKHVSPSRQSQKVYVRKDLIQSKEKDETVTLIKHYSPVSNQKVSTHLNNVLQMSCEKYSLNNNKQNAYLNNCSVVKTLDFDGNKKKRNKESKGGLAMSDMFELEAKCEYQVGDLAWAKMGTYPYWPCIVTRDPISGMFVKKKLFGRIDREMIHVTFFGDNGRRSWILGNMLRKFLGQLEFEATRDKFTGEARKKDPRSAAFFVSEKKMPQWLVSVGEAESLLREPKRLRIDILNDMLNKARTLKTTPKGSRKVARTDSDVSLSESLYDTLFSEDDTKTSDLERSKQKTRNKSLDVSEVVTACLDNMAAKTGITKIQKQSHMDRWLQKAKSKTPEKSQLKSQTNNNNSKQDVRRNKRIKKEPDSNVSSKCTVSDSESPNEADNKLHAHQNEHDYSIHCSSDFIDNSLCESDGAATYSEPGSLFGVKSKVESISDKSISNTSNDNENDVVISDICILNEETVASSDNVFTEESEISNVLIKNERTLVHDEPSITDSIDSVGTKSFDDRDEISMDVSESQLTYNSNESTDTPKLTEIPILTTNPNIDNFLVDSKTSKFTKSDALKEAQMDIILNCDETTSSVDLKTNLTHEGDDVKYGNCQFHSKCETQEDDISSMVDSNEESMEKPVKTQDDLTIAEDQEKQDVNIAKTIITDKSVGNNVDLNRIAFNVDEISSDNFFTVNDDSNLTIPEPNGCSNIITSNDCNRVNNYVDSKRSMNSNDCFGSSNILEDNSTDSTLYETSNTAHTEEIISTVDNTLVGSLSRICSDVIFRYNSKTEGFKEYCVDGESMTEEFLPKNDEIDVVTNGIVQDKDDAIESDPLIHCNLYLSSDDDESSISTKTDVNEFTNLDKYKTRFMKKNFKHLTLQEALLRKDIETKSKIIDQDVVTHEKFEVLDESNSVSATQEEISTLDERSQNTSGESERCFPDSNFAHEETITSDDRSQNAIERCSTNSNYTFDSDNKSLYSDAQTETTTENTESTETMDVDDSTYDSINQNGYHEPNKVVPGSDFIHGTKVSLHVNISKEKEIMSGDELRLTPHGLEVINENCVRMGEDIDNINVMKHENDVDTASVVSTDSEISLGKRKMRWKVDKPSVSEKKNPALYMEHPDFLKYLEFKQDAIYDEHPELSQDEITTYLYNTWLYEESLKTDRKKTDDIESASMVKGLQSELVRHPKKARKRVKVEKEKYYEPHKDEQAAPKQKPRRRTVRPSYNEEYTDVEEDLEVYSIPKPKELSDMKIEPGTEHMYSEHSSEVLEAGEEELLDEVDEVEEYFARLTDPKPNVFKGLLREKVCEICERTGKLVKCKGCSSMFHVDCAKKETKIIEVQAPMKGRKKKKKFKGRKSKSDDNGLDESQSDERDANVSEENANTSTENIEPEPFIVTNADDFEAQLAIKMKELLGDSENVYKDIVSSEEELDWSDTEAGKCEVVNIKLRKKEDESEDYSDFKCNNCQKYDVPICFVCRRADSPKSNALHRQRCQVAHCNKYYHLECLEHWPQTQFNSGECARYNKKINEYFEALSCPRHVCHTCVSDDPRGCKTRFSGDKLARCVRCPATYHTFTKCLPAGSQILTGSHIICPRHHEHRPGKIPCHVNTGWCFICALGGTLICCEYCPTSFHAECLNIKPPEGGYMCEDCETGRLPLYGEMVWVKLGHYRWWPGIILHPCEIPENILAVKHSPGEFVVRFFGQYDHYWVNRGRVFPFQEGDSGKVSSQKSKIDAAFTMAMEHAQRACEILKSAAPNEEESSDIASSLLPPHYVKLRANKPCGALCGRRVDEESSLTQCECSPDDDQPCGPYSHCLNRMLLTECGPTCRAGDRCHNRAFEKRLYPKLVPYRTPHRGWGLKTLEDIKAGQFVIEYVGELIDEEEFQRRMRRKHEIRDENYYFLTLDKERMIDAGPKGNLARFMNHCCEPNCETQKWTVLGDVRVGLFALYDIPANSEVTFNYNLESAGIEKKRCLCGAKRCSGYIGAKLKQVEPKKPKRPYNKKRKIEDSPSTSKAKPKSKLGRPPKPKELTEIEKDLLIIKNATNGISSDSDCSGRLSSIESLRDSKASKRKRLGHSADEPSSSSNSPSTKRIRLTEEKCSEFSNAII